MRTETVLNLEFESLGVMRRAALGLLPHVKDPERNVSMHFSSYKSSRNYEFINNNEVKLDGGYRLCRATRSLPTDKKYYWEFCFSKQSAENSHARFGISTLKADMEAPVGIDEYGYSVRDLGGSYHEGHRNKNIITPPFQKGDIVGLGFVPGENSISLELFINGNLIGTVFDNIDKNSKWFPSISIFKGGIVESNFSGPFAFDPGSDYTAAGNIPNEQDKGTIDPKKLIKIMKTSLFCAENEKQFFFEAMDAALVPAHLMVI